MARVTLEERDRLARRFAENLSRLRKAASLSQDELGQEAAVHPAWIRHLESGNGLPNIITATRIADALGIGLGTLVAGMTLR